MLYDDARHVRRPARRDLRPMARLDRLVRPGRGWGTTTIKSMLADDRVSCLVAGGGESVHGMAFAYRHKRFLELYYLATHPGSRRRGVATSLLNSYRLLFPHVYSMVPEDNLPLQLFLRARGFRCYRARPVPGEGLFYEFAWQGADPPGDTSAVRLGCVEGPPEGVG